MGTLAAALALSGCGAVDETAPTSVGSAQNALEQANCPQQFVTGYYAVYYGMTPEYQAPQHVDMTAMTHLVLAHILPGYQEETADNRGKIMLGDDVLQVNKKLGPGAPTRSIEDYLIARAHQVSTKALIMLGGSEAKNTTGFRQSLAPEFRARFIAELLDYMVRHDYDGVDVDFEGFLTPSDEVLLEDFIVELRAAAALRARYSAQPIIITYPGGLKNTNREQVTAHDLRMATLVDQYNLMSYASGYFGEGWPTTTFSPLLGQEPSHPMDIASTIQMYVDAGVPRCKLGVGVGFYGNMYKAPHAAPGEAPIAQPGNEWSTDDNLWNFSKLSQGGYLDHGTAYWDDATKTRYRSYPGGYTAPGSSTAVGYITYEDEASIAAKGAWSKSGAAGAGAGGAMIWLVNYGAPNGVTNPLLTAVKRAFLDPNASDPGPNPNGELPQIAVPAEELSYEQVTTASWAGHYCAEVIVTNLGTTTGVWTIDLPFPADDHVTGVWQAQYVAVPGALRVSGPSWAAALEPGQAATFGFCAETNQSGPSTPPVLSGSITLRNDWSSGWYAEGTITNTGGPAAGWTLTLPLPASGTVTSVGNARFTQNGSSITLRGIADVPDMAAGATLNFNMVGSR